MEETVCSYFSSADFEWKVLLQEDTLLTFCFVYLTNLQRVLCASFVDRLALVVRLGGSSCSVSCFCVIDGIYKLLSDIHTYELGGDMFTELIAGQFAKDFQR